MADYEMIQVEQDEAVGIIRLHRPKALNALCVQLIDELGAALADMEANDEIRCIILTGSEKAFAAGADIKEMKEYDFVDVYKMDFITDDWERVAKCRKPIIGAVAGFALGGGCEMAMMCDTIIAADTAKFSQPEITIGTIAGAGGTQRLTRSIGKAKAMLMNLTGEMISAEEAERAGLVAKVVPADELMTETLRIAKKIAGFSPLAAMMAKESVNKAYETTLREGLMVERRLFHSTFNLEDRKEGMTAFAEKRKPNFQGK